MIRKADLREHWDGIMVFDEARDLVSSSGTTGRPVDIPVKQEEDQSRVMRVGRLLKELGVGPGSRVLQLLSLNDLFTLGPLAWQATKSLGACGIRCSAQRLGRMRQVLRYVTDMMLADEDPYDAFLSGNAAPRQQLRLVT